MIKLTRLEKFYNKNRTNEIHVINDISLSLPSEGLVVLLGPSGSGKTTLLNVLGGLDKVQSGSIDFDGTDIPRYNSSVWDKIRNKDIGYIFQNYNLLNNMTVYENISLTLNMIGIYDKDEIDRRINYILENIGMINYRKRKASQLSGGQQQRVAIARALAKNPKVIIADEPTGNLDSKNTQDIMNIIKSISRTKLVVLVTHEENIANFYGDRIIRLQDGKIVSDEDNRSNGTLDVQHDTDIYLGDLRKVIDNSVDNATIALYSDEETKDKLDIRLIVKNKTLYIDVQSEQYQKKQLLETDSEINLIDGKYEHIDRDTYQTFDFDLDEVANDNLADSSKHSVISVKDSLRIAWNRFKQTTFSGKILYVAFAGVAALIAVAIAMLNGILIPQTEDFLSDAKELIMFDRGNNTYDEILTAIDDPSIAYLRYVDDIVIDVELPTFFQSWSNETDLVRKVVHADQLQDNRIINGREIQQFGEFVIDKRVADSMTASSEYRYVGITSYSDLYELDYSITITTPFGSTVIPLTLVGIVDDESPVIYLDEDLILMHEFQMGIYEQYEDSLIIELGTDLDADDELLVGHVAELDLPTLSALTYTFSNETFAAVGSFTTTRDNVPPILIRRDALKEAYFEATYPSQDYELTVYANDVNDALDTLESEQFDAEGYFQTTRLVYRQDRIAASIGIVTFNLVMLGASALSYFFILRSSLLARIYEVSVYRALGVTKWDIIKMFVTEIVMITTITSLIGYLFLTTILYRIELMADDFMDLMTVTPLSIVIGVVIIYVVNIVAGLIPVFNLLNRTPAEILSKYDF